MTVSFILAAILSLARPPAVDPVLERHRLELLARDIHLSAAIGDSPFTGPAAKEASALALVSIAWGESAFRAEVADCRIVGSDLPSVSAYQLVGHFALAGSSPADVCDSEALAAYLALGVLRRHASRCRLCTHQQLFHAYASGNAQVKSDAGREHCRRWARLAQAAGLVGATCRARRPINFAPPQAVASSAAVAPRHVEAAP